MNAATQAGSSTDGIKDNTGALQGLQSGEGLGPGGSMAKPPGTKRRYP